MKWEKICTEMKHSWQHIHRIHAKALKKFHNVMECDYKGVIYCKKQIGPSGNGGLFYCPFPGA